MNSRAQSLINSPLLPPFWLSCLELGQQPQISLHIRPAQPRTGFLSWSLVAGRRYQALIDRRNPRRGWVEVVARSPWAALYGSAISAASAPPSHPGPPERPGQSCQRLGRFEMSCPNAAVGLLERHGPQRGWSYDLHAVVSVDLDHSAVVPPYSPTMVDARLHQARAQAARGLMHHDDSFGELTSNVEVGYCTCIRRSSTVVSSTTCRENDPRLWMMTSARYTMQQIHSSPHSTQSIRRWKVDGALQRPKGMRLILNNPCLVVNAHLSLSSTSTATCQ
ncbi:TPA: hypothetical protein N0F65_004679 [Lagenidium giganteum]|uniref:Uncharacterized protein n=1 Tax=Lagenidium giganteum TaxID=4803 RepID=A0AAV2Z3X3_9STRA|nr:TPA: hypothetical protein N0F65_004679 [Lagenidium giganteum]